MDKVFGVIKEIKQFRLDNPDRVCALIRKLQAYRKISQSTIDPDVFFHGLAIGLEKIADYRTSCPQYDSLLDQLSDKIEAVVEREGLGEYGYFKIGDPNAPEDYTILNLEYDKRMDEITSEVMCEFDEEIMADLFKNNTKEYFKRYYSGWRAIEKDNPAMLKEIDDSEQDELKRL
jgi:hypothetical protein